MKLIAWIVLFVTFLLFASPTAIDVFGRVAASVPENPVLSFCVCTTVVLVLGVFASFACWCLVDDMIPADPSIVDVSTVGAPVRKRVRKSPRVHNVVRLSVISISGVIVAISSLA